MAEMAKLVLYEEETTSFGLIQEDAQVMDEWKKRIKGATQVYNNNI